MNNKIVSTLLLFAAYLITAYSPAAFAGGQFNAKCTYSHSLPDDSIVHYGQPGQAMMHDFFGNTKTDAYSDHSTLLTNKVTTCDSTSDISAYWVPQLKRASGIVQPDFAKTYYKNDQPVVSLSPIPAGLQMLAGDHMSNSPKPQINYLCRGGGYTTIAPTNCPVVTDASGIYSQLDISVHFPDCWDGVHLKPDLANQIINMAYRQSDGTCPASYPIKIPELQVNVQYSLGQNPDLSTAQLSMDPMLTNGTWMPMWGSLFTAHADFINGWKIDSMQYAIDKCSNANVACDNQIPTFYAPAIADAWMNSTGVTTTTGPTLQAGPGDIIFLKFSTPSNTSDYPWSKAFLQTQGQNVTDTSAIMLNLYAAASGWNESSPLPQAVDCSTQSVGGIYLDNANIRRLNDVTNYVKSAIASGAQTIGICVRNATGRTVAFSSKDGVFAPALFMK
ncbi:DUF1996 domain-containing protein [Caballeronia cordobensis]|uniref:DUF1996 domain-containing protein n=1 Tax=Caballeronia cordobensis TaxID=1353886 RepID=UPI00045F085D|nr:putative uncharacterized protein [Burkholderia sp. RPE67]